MIFQWLQMRITEEKDRRERENNILNRLPSALEEVRGELAGCLDAYNAAFGEARAVLETAGGAIHITSGDHRVRVMLDPLLPGFQVDRGESKLAIEVGILPGGNLFFRDAEKYITLEEMTRLTLDRALFPKLKE
jgi:hypothetical protein